MVLILENGVRMPMDRPALVLRSPQRVPRHGGIRTPAVLRNLVQMLGVRDIISLMCSNRGILQLISKNRSFLDFPTSGLPVTADRNYPFGIRRGSAFWKWYSAKKYEEVLRRCIASLCARSSLR